MRKLNDFLAEKATLVFGTMWMFYAFFIYGLLPLIPILARYQSQIFYWSGWVQLWALPLLMVGQNVLGRAGEKRDQETHDAVMQELAFVKEELALARNEREELKMLLAHLHVKIPDVIRQCDL
ncbi:hypothetical protein REC12_11605 [Desulfosporosinus sp. PR]|uniref:hypothetical protein n=1 Tax=Candidatus Desulfosporosinus nitrosoreducens TaxID=3401928 RepID=UPI0027FA53BD|nr:hypothetical protein [Desulfosporosinus sp. PR]MDQ7094235.1 hypothetical protein [Desulfosporosinus sp. PR]